MKILFVISSIGLGGAEQQVVLLSKELARRGHSVCIYVLTRETDRSDQVAGSSVELVLDHKRMRLDLGVLWRLRRRITMWRPDIVHGFLFDGNLYSRLAAFGSGVPVLDSERNDNYVLQKLHSIGYRLTLGMTSGVVANTYSGADFARRARYTNATRVHVVWNGIDLGEVDSRLARRLNPAQELVSAIGAKRVCVVGTIKPQKDHFLAIRVARRLVDIDPAWHVICVGDKAPDALGDFKTAVLAERDRLGLQRNVHFVGNRRDVLEIMASCDALLVTSLHEGFPNVVLEAMACGTPVVSTYYSDIRRILPMPWQIVASRDESELADSLVRCYAERHAVAAAQRRWVEVHATVAASADKMLAVYASYARSPFAPLEPAA